MINRTSKKERDIKSPNAHTHTLVNTEEASRHNDEMMHEPRHSTPTKCPSAKKQTTRVTHTGCTLEIKWIHPRGALQILKSLKPNSDVKILIIIRINTNTSTRNMRLDTTTKQTRGTNPPNVQMQGGVVFRSWVALLSPPSPLWLVLLSPPFVRW